MPFLYLLDTNNVSDIVRHPRGEVARRLSEIDEDTVCINIIVACELRFGAKKRSLPKLTRDVESLLQALPTLPLRSPIEQHYAEIRTSLEKAGTPYRCQRLTHCSSCASSESHCSDR